MAPALTEFCFVAASRLIGWTFALFSSTFVTLSFALEGDILGLILPVLGQFHIQGVVRLVTARRL